MGSLPTSQISPEALKAGEDWKRKAEERAVLEAPFKAPKKRRGLKPVPSAEEGYVVSLALARRLDELKVERLPSSASNMASATPNGTPSKKSVPRSVQQVSASDHGINHMTSTVTPDIGTPSDTASSEEIEDPKDANYVPTHRGKVQQTLAGNKRQPGRTEPQTPVKRTRYHPSLDSSPSARG